MKTKNCSLCKHEVTTLYRVQIEKGKIWIFICTECCNKVKSEPTTDMVVLGKVTGIEKRVVYKNWFLVE
ncbi:MAG: hypothetical protein MUE72_01435 [Chitinophagaceae bacterium]|nr:hypothetical protein [Chitinophagaceae bacterium]